MEKKLQRNEQNRVVGGVCAGLADYFEIDPTWVRLAFVFGAFPAFFGIPAYIIFWIVIPPKPIVPLSSGFNSYNTDYRVPNERNFSTESDANYAKPMAPFTAEKSKGNGKLIFGILFILFGSFFLLNEFHLIPYWFDLGKLWPLVFIIPGIVMILKSGQNDNRKKATKKEQIYTESTSEQIKPDTDQPSI